MQDILNQIVSNSEFCLVRTERNLKHIIYLLKSYISLNIRTKYKQIMNKTFVFTNNSRDKSLFSSRTFFLNLFRNGYKKFTTTVIFTFPTRARARHRELSFLLLPSIYKNKKNNVVLFLSK